MDTRGLTLVEVLIAVVVLTVGVLAAASTGALITRALTEGRRTTAVALAAASRIETLRRVAQSTSPRCAGLAGGSAVQGWILERWSVTPSNRVRLVVATISYRLPRSFRTDSITTIIAC